MINIEKARKVFAEYVSKYDSNNAKIIEKTKHTYRVSEVSNIIASGIELNEEDTELARLIGILHDIGRFEQMRRYNTFVDANSINHAEFGVKILFEDNLIREFIEENKFDNIIKMAVLNHNRYKIEDGLQGDELLHSKIIRDADKIDDLYISANKTYNLDNNELISEEVFNAFVNNICALYSKAKTNIDMHILHIAWIYDFNFDFSIELLKEKDYINKIIDNINCENKDTFDKIQGIRKVANDFLRRRTQDEKRS